MLNGETYVLEAVRDILRRKLSLSDIQCDCEYDEQIPAIAGDLYVAVIPSGFEPGPKHNTSGGVHDVLHSVQVFVISRAVTARDRRRTIFLERLTGLNFEIDRIIQAIDWQNDVLSYANALLYADYPAAKPFITTLRLQRVDTKPRMVDSKSYGGDVAGGKGTTPYVAMCRSVYFGRMQRIQAVSQLAPAGLTV